MVKRMVGYSEYTSALRMLDMFASTLDDAEREQVDDYIRERDAFAVEINQSANLQQGNSSLTHPYDAATEKRGLDWMTALARVELGAMLAGFTGVDRPFDVVNPTKQDMEAYRYLLLDAVRTHYWALKQDPVVEYLPTSKDIIRVLAYSRRMMVIRGMLDTLSRSGRTWTFPETQELMTWAKEMGGLRDMLSLYVHEYLKAHVTTRRQTDQETFYTGCAKSCVERMGGSVGQSRANTSVSSGGLVPTGTSVPAPSSTP